MDPEEKVKEEIKVYTDNWCLRLAVDKGYEDHYYITLSSIHYPLPPAVLYETDYYEEAENMYYDMLPVIQMNEKKLKGVG